MVNYLFANKEQRELAEDAYKILEKELKPRIEEYENADGGLGVYPKEVHDKLVEAGYYAIFVPEEWGGIGLDSVSQAVIMETMGQIDAGFAFAFVSGVINSDKIAHTGMSREEKQLWYDKVQNGAVGCFNLTEANAGSDVAAMRTTAVYDEKTDEWVINGTKCFASGSPNADYFITVAWTDKTKRASQGCTAFFVEKERGVKIGKKENKLGLHLSETADIIYEDVRVPADHVIGEVGKGFGIALSGIKGAGAIVNCCPTLGAAQAALDFAIDYAKTRRQFGKRIIDHQAVGFMIADMMMKVEACRALMYTSLQAAQQDIPNNLDLINKCYITDNCFEVCNMAMQVLGGYGYMKEYPIERMMRNARIFQIFGGTNQIKRKNLMKSIAGRDPEAAKK